MTYGPPGQPPQQPQPPAYGRPGAYQQPGAYIPGQAQQAPGAPYPGAHYGESSHPGGTPPRRGRGCLIGALIVVAVVVIGMIVVVSLVINMVQSTVDSAMRQIDGALPNTLSASVEPVPLYVLDERPLFASTRAEVDAMFEKYSGGGAAALVPQTVEGRQYAHAFTMTLLDLKTAFTFMTGSVHTSTDPDELDGRILYLGDQAREYERRFLAGEDLNVSVRINNRDGSISELDGSSPIVDTSEAEAFARSFTGAPDANGNYAASAEELASHFGIRLNYEMSDLLRYCTPPEILPANELLAAYCYFSPEIIYINQGYGDFSGALSNRSFVDVIKHELSHHLIGLTCQTISPGITGAINEGVTSSYAVLFLGANYNNLQNTRYSEYTMTEHTDALARQIHDNRTCG
ncbi:hypothetical protein [Mycetocola spongiae]|uniref:hypothetical protein n=1 Tax=Mycetocola spongiae TaxID=2859226 RepID=UPI001CF3EA63|nr:hypothetical protein [Mycetocola spongiae]UCR87949.1 hypothetical protein KXZ72_07955 [Mycetocola spongiae]